MPEPEVDDKNEYEHRNTTKIPEKLSSKQSKQEKISKKHQKRCWKIKKYIKQKLNQNQLKIQHCWNLIFDMNLESII